MAYEQVLEQIETKHPEQERIAILLLDALSLLAASGVPTHWLLTLNNDADAHHARITDDTGRSIRVTYQLDQYDRLTRLEMGLDD